MQAYQDQLMQNTLFQGLTKADYATLLEPDACILGHYQKHTVIVQEGERCRSIGFLLCGALSAQQLSPTGQMVKVRMFHAGDCFGAALLFAPQSYYSYTLFTSSRTNILYLPYEQIRAVLDTSLPFNRNYLAYLSQRVRQFSAKIQILSQKDVRSRIILYVNHAANKTQKLSFSLKHSKTDIADLLGVARPSLSRELNRMQKDGLIEIDQTMVTIKNPHAFGLLF